MSGGWFLVSSNEVLCSENIIKIRSLVEEGFDIEDRMKVITDHHIYLEILENNIEPIINDAENILLNEESREVTVYIAGYAAYKVKWHCEGCGIVI